MPPEPAAEIPLHPTAPPPAPMEVRSTEASLRIARRVFRGALAYTLLLTVFWLAVAVIGPERAPIFGGYRVDAAAAVRVIMGFLFMSVLWGWLWYGVRYALLRRYVGLSTDEAREVLSSRMKAPFDVSRYIAAYSERRIRITDMIGRRGRFLTLGVMGFYHVYARLAVDPKPEYLLFGMYESLFDAVAFAWLNLAAFRSEGFLGRLVYGAQSRLMDGTLGRANCLLITMLWGGFKFLMLPLSVQLGLHFPSAALAPIFAFIWCSYVAADGLSEIVGALFGRQKIRVWGIGDVNRKSWEGTIAGFLGSLALCLLVVFAHGLPSSWIALAVVVSVSNALLELFSPRGTDDITMATTNALLCWGFGALVY
jgi:hypothetical protein